jgi:DNA-binding transcriptional MerR regulator
MKISELAEASGTAIPTIKFYIREGLLPAGESSSRTQARYSDEHLRRLDLIAILQAELGMSVEKIGEVLREADRGGGAMLAMGLRNARASRKRRTADGAPPTVAISEAAASPELKNAWRLVRRLAKSMRWKLEPGSFMAADVAEAVATILRAMPGADIGSSLNEYARAMKSIADWEIPDTFDPDGEP